MVILEFTGDRIKLLKTVRTGRGTGITRLLKQAVDGRSDDSVADAVAAMLKEAGVRKGTPLTICVPRHLVTVRTLRFPSVDDPELKNMADLQAGKQLPYPQEELVWDYKVIEKRPDGYSDIFLAIAHRNVVDRYIDVLKKTGMDIERIALSSEAVSGWSLAVSGLAGTRAVLDVDASYIDVVVIRGEKMEFSRSFPLKQDFAEMAEEIRKTFVSYQKENSREISSVVLTGIEEKALALRSALAGVLPPMNTDFIHPLKILSEDYRESLPDYSDTARDISIAPVLGIAYGLPQVTMDFLPAQIKRDNRRRARKKIFIRAALLILAIKLVVAAIIFRGAINEKEMFQTLNLKIKETEPKVAKLKEISQDLAIIKAYLDTEGSAVDVMREVYRIVPQGVSIAVLDFELDKSLALRGGAADLNSVFKFTSDLEKSGHFKNCQIKYAQKRTVKTRELVDFEITCALSRRAK
ncbi:MAG: pilus assembly protein PilM [Candidatus Omnitrophica bacterium]|nr:pilus assembly protein PilM [Candidatus Omnitrophota bacterium]